MALTSKAGVTKSKGKFTAKLAKPPKPSLPEEEDEEEEFNDDSNSDTSSAMDVSQSEAESDYDDLAKARKLAIKRNTKRGKTADADEFSTILTSILAQDSRDTNAPIMAKDRTRENQIREELISYRARKALVDEKRQLLNKDR
ncbi:hypothetical protein GGI06_001798, partial [Coemansia sp. S85]